MVIRQELEIGQLRSHLAEESLARRRCEDNRRREGRFLEAVIGQCKGDNVPLTDTSCSDFCRRNQVTLPVCKALCETKVPPCSYWHQDTRKDPIVSFEDVTNRTRRANSETELWQHRLEAYRELRRERDTEQEQVWEEGAVEEEKEVVWNPETSELPQIQVIQLSNVTACHQVSCVSHNDTDTVACLDFSMLDKPAGFFRLQSGC